MYYNFIKTNKKIDFSYLLRNIFILLLFFVISFLVNKINNSYFIAHGDFIQFISFKEDINNIFSTWRGINQDSYNGLIVWAFFYLFQKALFFIGFTSSIIANMIIFLFLVSSFYSFYF